MSRIIPVSFIISYSSLMRSWTPFFTPSMMAKNASSLSTTSGYSSPFLQAKYSISQISPSQGSTGWYTGAGRSALIRRSLRSIKPATAGCSLQKPSGLFAYRSRGLDVSTHYLSRIIYRQTGRTLNDWIADTLMVEIKYHLTCTDKTIEEISEDLSFCSTSAFIQYFKSKTGCTPFKYRRDQNLKTQ